ncbi:hypothetical protein AVV29_gp139 [Vibrio phage phi 3]|uniref:Bacteriophage T5 Orf172 DNA-binding domain-containing protein n=1 Tax=Vibrio phage phi 3 TaxID=1589298 RepID=A0A0B5HAR1_9CAUD|nr:hypothetical protein AVV29_gp139 [Vibrio phage phi 3]AJF40839.1 hypothetical protein SBVP3_0072 [Vibrio phage phi 3]
MKTKSNNRDDRVSHMLQWLRASGLFDGLPSTIERAISGYAMHMTRAACTKKYGKVDRSLKYFNTQLSRQRLFATMTMNILCHRLGINSNIGYVYIVSNPAYPGWFKVGAAKDAETRLITYQTSSPFRDFRLEWYMPCTNYKELEKQFHSISGFTHEWVNLPLKEVKEILLTLV